MLNPFFLKKSVIEKGETFFTILVGMNLKKNGAIRFEGDFVMEPIMNS